MKIKRISSFTAALFLSLSSLLVLYVPRVAAATVTWDGEGGDNNFSTAANWSGDAVPSNGDSLVFDNSIWAADETLNNDLSGASFANISFTGSGFDSLTLSGNSFTLTGGITTNVPVALSLEAAIALSGDQTVSIVELDGNVVMSGQVSGSGNLTKSGDGYLAFSSANIFTGSLTISDGNVSALDKDALGTSAGGTIVSNGGHLNIALPDGQKTATITEPLTLNGSSFSDSNGTSGILTSRSACGMVGASTCDGTNITYSGAITLGANAKVSTWGTTMTINGALSGAYTIQLFGGDKGTLIVNSSNNTSQTPNGESQAPAETITIAEGDSQPFTSVTIGFNQVYIINGTRGVTAVNNGGVLKGTGTVGNLSVSSGGKLAPGESPGCLSTGDLMFQPGSSYDFELGGVDACSGYDQIKVTGTVTLNPGVGSGTGPVLNVIRFNDFKPSAGQTFMIIENDGTDAVLNGTFNNLAEGATFEVDGYVLRISYVGGTGNDVVLTVVTVPATPNTGFGLLLNNPIAIFAGTAMGAAGILAIARKQKLAFQRSR